MEAYSKAVELLGSKKEHFLQIEVLTESMKTAPLEELLVVFEQRGEILKLVEDLDKELGLLAKSAPCIKDALNNAAPPLASDKKLAVIYKLSLDIKAAANRILKTDPEILQRVENERKQLLERLEEMNNSGSSVASSYMRSVQTGVTVPSLMGNDKTI